MREIRQSGSEGGGDETNRLSLPLSKGFASNYAALIEMQSCVSQTVRTIKRAEDTATLLTRLYFQAKYSTICQTS